MYRIFFASAAIMLRSGLAAMSPGCCALQDDLSAAKSTTFCSPKDINSPEDPAWATALTYECRDVETDTVLGLVATHCLRGSCHGKAPYMLVHSLTSKPLVVFAQCDGFTLKIIDSSATTIECPARTGTRAGVSIEDCQDGSVFSIERVTDAKNSGCLLDV